MSENAKTGGEPPKIDIFQKYFIFTLFTPKYIKKNWSKQILEKKVSIAHCYFKELNFRSLDTLCIFNFDHSITIHEMVISQTGLQFRATPVIFVFIH